MNYKFHIADSDFEIDPNQTYFLIHLQNLYDLDTYNNSEIVLLILVSLDTENIYLFNIGNYELRKWDVKNLFHYFDRIDNLKIITYNTKKLRYVYNNVKKFFDLDLYEFLFEDVLIDKRLYLDSLSTILKQYKSFYSSILETEKIKIINYIPIYKLVEILLKENMKKIEKAKKIKNFCFSLLNDKTYQFYSEVNETLYRLENQQIAVDPEKLKYYYNLYSNTEYENLITPCYSFYTITSRLSCFYQNLYFYNLDEERKNIFKSRYKNGMFLVYDYLAYHLNLLLFLFGYEIRLDKSFYYDIGEKELGYDKNEIRNNIEIYSKVKNYVFSLLYGSKEVYIKNDLLRGLKQKLIDLVDKFQQKNEFFFLISKRKIKIEENFSFTKIINYVIQNFEFEFTYYKVKQILDCIEGNDDIKLMLWHFDSFIFDINLESKNLDIKTIKEIEKIISEGNFYYTKKIGICLNNLKLIV